MSKSKRTVIAIVVIELLLAGGWIWLHGMAATSSRASSDSTRVIGEVFGGAMALILGLSPVLILMARRNDRRERQMSRPGEFQDFIGSVGAAHRLEDGRVGAE